ERLLHRRVAAADHDQPLVTEEEAVACGTCRDAPPGESLLTGDIEPLGGSAGGDDDRLGPVFVCAHPQPEGLLGEVDTVDVDGHQARAEPFSLLAETVHQLGPLDPVGETRIVLYFGRDHQLATSREALEDDGL